MREAGSTAVQEVAFTLANGLAYVEAALARGLAIDDFAPRLSFFFNAHNNFLEEVAKFRAARRLWAELVRERFAPKDPRSLWLRFHTQTAGSTLTAQQPHEQRRAGGDPGARRGLRRHPVAAHQLARRGAGAAHRGGGAPRPAHPAGDRPRERRRRRGRPAGRLLRDRGLDRRDRRSGRATTSAASTRWAARSPPSSSGFQQREIADAAYRHQLAVEEGRAKVVGVNAFADEEEAPTEVLRDRPGGRARAGRAPRAPCAPAATPRRAAAAARGPRAPRPARTATSCRRSSTACAPR